MDRLQIIIFGLLPGWGWACLLAVTCATLFMLLRRHALFREIVPGVLLLGVGIQSAVAAIAAVLTDRRDLNMFSCLSGALGILIVPVVTGIEIGMLAYFLKRSRARGPGARVGTMRCFAVWFLVKGLVWLVLLRSGLMCTV